MRPLRLFSAISALAGLSGPGHSQVVPSPRSLAETCGSLHVADACEVIAQATLMLAPSYERGKAKEGVAAFAARGYKATYVKAKKGILQSTTDLFLVSRPGSNRLFVVITGTESKRDWFENAKFGRFTGKPLDGQFYVPPAHAGFRRGMLNIINTGVLRHDEFDDEPLRCAELNSKASLVSRHLCETGMPTGPGAVEVVIVGHSRGAGIGLVIATAFAGLEIKRPVKDGPIEVKPQRYWPLRLHAVVGFADPTSDVRRQDAFLMPRGTIREFGGVRSAS